jgi:hypothetical protein
VAGTAASLTGGNLRGASCVMGGEARAREGVRRCGTRRRWFGFYRAPDLTLDCVPGGIVSQQIRVYDPADGPLFAGLSCSSHVDQDPDEGQPDFINLLSVRDGSTSAAARLHTWLD